MRQIFIYLALLSGFLFSAGCQTTTTQRDTLKQIYDRSAQYHQPDRNPIIVIPGILGSRLVDDDSGQTIWGAFRADYANPNTQDGAQLISLPISDRYNHKSGHVRPDGVLENLELNLAGFPIEVQAYAGILSTLGAGGYRDQTLGLNSIDYGTDHFTCFQFDYDWRQDISYNAKALKTFIAKKRAEVQKSYEKEFGIKNADVKFDIAAHSMGALLTRYYLRYGAQALPENDTLPVLNWDGANDIERAILVAPPNAGSLEAFDQLVNGFNTGRPLLPFYDPAIIGTFPSLYQLLPRSHHHALIWDDNPDTHVTDILDPDLWQKYGWGLSGNDPDTQHILQYLLPDITDPNKRQDIAHQYQAKALNQTKSFQKALDIAATPPDHVEMILVAGDASETPSVISVDSETGDTSVFRTEPGDSVVLRSSALLDERVGGEWSPRVKSPLHWTSVLFLPAEHRDITSNAVFEDNILYWLLEAPRDNMRAN